MTAHTDIQIINGKDGAPAFVVMPYEDWLAQRDREQSLVPGEVVDAVFDNNWSPMRAWREYLALTQADVAARAGITQAAYAQMENAEHPRHATLRKIAAAMGLTVAQLDF